MSLRMQVTGYGFFFLCVCGANQLMLHRWKNHTSHALESSTTHIVELKFSCAFLK